MSDLITRDSLKDMLDTDKYGREYVEQVIGRALWALFQRQTESERVGNYTSNVNSIGFSGADAHSGSITAKYWKKHGNLGAEKGESWRMEKWLKKANNGYPRLCKYAAQLNEIATKRGAKTSS